MNQYDEGYSQALHDILTYVAHTGDEQGLYAHALKVTDDFIATSREKYNLD